jgi:hypothetical protein
VVCQWAAVSVVYPPACFNDFFYFCLGFGGGMSMGGGECCISVFIFNGSV